MSYWSVEIEVPGELADWLSWLIAERLEVAVEIQDNETLTLGPDAETCKLIIRTEDEPNSTWVEAMRGCLDEVGQTDAPLRSRHETDDSWRLGWRAFFKPTEVAPGVIVRPPWAEASAAVSSDIDDSIERTSPVSVIIDPGLAFGTGTHATTQLAAGLLKRALDDVKEGESWYLLDQGCGSGILSLIAARLGHRVRGIELDPVAARNANENVALNGLTAEHVNITAGERVPAGDYDLVIMNIIAPVLIDLAPQINELDTPLLILSGLLADQELQVLKAYSEWRVTARERSGDWLGLTLKRGATT